MKSEFRKAYEQKFGVVNDWLELYDGKGNTIYRESSDKNWYKYEYDSEGNETYFENSMGYWVKYEYDDKGNVIYRKDSTGDAVFDKRNNLEGKIATIDGKEYKLTGIR
jgi:uncharacterized protein RhaS with RHS repeats